MPSALEQYLIVTVGQVGDLVKLIAGALVTFGDHILDSVDPSNPSYSMNLLATGLYDEQGVIYFWNEKIIWFLTQIDTIGLVNSWVGFGDFLTALADAGLI